MIKVLEQVLTEISCASGSMRFFENGAFLSHRALRPRRLQAKSIRSSMPQNSPNFYWHPGKAQFYE